MPQNQNPFCGQGYYGSPDGGSNRKYPAAAENPGRRLCQSPRPVDLKMFAAFFTVRLPAKGTKHKQTPRIFTTHGVWKDLFFVRRLFGGQNGD